MRTYRYTTTNYTPKKSMLCITNNGAHRFLLEFESRANVSVNDNVLFIGLNPSKANMKISDRSVNLCLKEAEKLKAKTVTICNVCSFYETKAQKFKIEWMSEHDENLKFLERAISKASKIIVFWGESMRYIDYKYREDIYNLLEGKEVLTGGETQNYFPKHISQRDGSFSLNSIPVTLHKSLTIIK